MQFQGMLILIIAVWIAVSMLSVRFALYGASKGVSADAARIPSFEVLRLIAFTIGAAVCAWFTWLNLANQADTIRFKNRKTGPAPEL